MISEPIPLMTVLAGITALAFWLDRRFEVLAKVGATLMVILFGAALSNLGWVAPASPVYDGVEGPVTKLGIVWLLLAVNLADLKRAGPRMLTAFTIACAGTVAGVVAASMVFAPIFGDQTWRMAGAFTGTYIGGSMNFIAVGKELALEPRLFAASAAADNVTSGLWYIALLTLPILLKRWYPSPVPEPSGDDESLKHPFHGASDISAGGLAKLFIAAFGVLWISDAIGVAVNSQFGVKIPSVLWLTTIALIAGHTPLFARMSGAMTLGTFALHLFLAVVGIHCRFGDILEVGLSVCYFTLMAVLIHGVIVYFVGRLFNIDLGTLSVASKAAIGGPAGAVALAVARGWPALILPGVIAGLIGYAVGTYAGFAVAHAVKIITG